MTRVLLAWEAGAGRGHVVTLARVARALQGMAPCDAALGWMDHAGEIAPWCEGVFPGVSLPYQRQARKERGAPPNATWADYLADCRMADGSRLRSNVAWWLDTYARRQTGLVVADYAPCALLAARIAGIPALAIGTGYGIPPADLREFPVFLPDHAEREADEGQMVAVVNEALGPLGLPPLDALPEIYTRSGDIVRTLPMLDPYAAWRSDDAYMPPVADFAGLRSVQADMAFCYFSTTELQNEGLVEALCACGLPLRGYLPGASDEVRARLAASGMHVESGPVPVAEIARTSRLILNSGQHGILCLSLGAGIPQVCIPQHLEQLYHARRAQDAGVARVVWPQTASASEILAAIGQAWRDTAMAELALERGRELAPRFTLDDRDTLRAKLAPRLSA